MRKIYIVNLSPSFAGALVWIGDRGEAGEWSRKTGGGGGGPSPDTAAEICRDNTTTNNSTCRSPRWDQGREWSSRIKSDVKRRRRDLQKKNPSTLRLTDCVSSLEGDASVVGRADWVERWKLSLIFLMVCCYEADPIYYYFVSTRRWVVLLLLCGCVWNGINHTISIRFIASKWDGYGLSMNALALLSGRLLNLSGNFRRSLLWTLFLCYETRPLV